MRIKYIWKLFQKYLLYRYKQMYFMNILEKIPINCMYYFRDFRITYLFAMPHSLLLAPIYFFQICITHLFCSLVIPPVSFTSFVLTSHLVPILFFSSAAPIFIIDVATFVTSCMISYHPRFYVCEWQTSSASLPSQTHTFFLQIYSSSHFPE